MITILCLDPSRGSCAFVWISKEIKQQKDTDNSMCVSCGAFFLKILNDLTKCNEGRVKTSVMPGAVPRCCSPIWAGDLLRSPVAKAGTELRSLDLISPQRQGSLRQPPTHSRFPFTHAGCCSQECCIKLLPRFALCKLQCHHYLICWVGRVRLLHEPRGELHSTGASQLLHSCSFEESSPAGCHVLLGEALAPCGQPYLVMDPAVFPVSNLSGPGAWNRGYFDG